MRPSADDAESARHALANTARLLPISGATASTYTISGIISGKTITCSIVANDGSGANNATATAVTAGVVVSNGDEDSDGVVTDVEILFGSNPLSASSLPTSQVIGQTDSTGVALANAVNNNGGENDTNPYAVSLPQGISVDSAGQRLFVADANNSRVLVFPLTASGTLASRKASNVLGQLDMVHNDTNGSGVATQSGLDVPKSAEFYDDGAKKWLMVTDDVDDRVVIYDITNGITNGMNASKVLGQANFTASSAGLTQTTLNAPRSAKVHIIGTKKLLCVTDKLNDRVMIWDITTGGISGLTNGQAASFVLGQPNFTTNGTVVDASSLDNPIGTAAWGNILFVSDALNDRILG